MRKDFYGSIYEVNVRQFTEEGTFNAFYNELDRLKKLGVETLWFMPIYPIGKLNRKGSLGSYYSISDYKAINPEFGNADDFRRIVTRAHQLRMNVVLDMVCNHTAWDNVWLTEEDNKSWYEQNDNGDILSPFDWSDTAKLNYSNSKMRKAMIEAMVYWVKEFKVDGFRQDMAGLVPLSFWKEAIATVRKVNPEAYFLGEVESADFHKRNHFNTSYSWEVGHMFEHIAQGAYGANALRDRLEFEKNSFPKSAGRLLFTSNHDENSWSGTEFERLGDAAKTFAALTYVLDGVPLIYSGQEAGNNRRLQFFEKDLIDWSGIEEYTKFYAELNKLRKNNAALAPYGKGGKIVHIDNSQPENILSFKRITKEGSIIAIFNLTPYHVQPAFYDKAYKGEWKKLFNKPQTLTEGEYDPFGPWEYKIYYK
ncbi:MAG: alpha-amylase family glycosyl hydrolase [Rikenellaceae bacterium]